MRRTYLVMFLVLAVTLPFLAHRPSDNERLDMALEYFQSGKYHEAILLFEQLDKEYALNERYHAFMGVCYYYEWQYADACKYLDAAMPHLEVFAPHERSVYYFTDGESHFQLQQYSEAIPHYEKALTVCFENEKGDIHYRLGLCYMFAEQWEAARAHYEQALNNYLLLRDTPDMKARIYQTASMMKGCEDKLKQVAASPPTATFSQGSAFAVNGQEKEQVKEQGEESSVSFGTVNTDSVQTDIIQITEMVSPSLASPISIPKISFNGDTTARPQRVTVPPVSPIGNNTLAKDTIRSEVPFTINIQEIYKPGVEIKE